MSLNIQPRGDTILLKNSLFFLLLVSSRALWFWRDDGDYDDDYDDNNNDSVCVWCDTICEMTTFSYYSYSLDFPLITHFSVGIFPFSILHTIVTNTVFHAFYLYKKTFTHCYCSNNKDNNNNNNRKVGWFLYEIWNMTLNLTKKNCYNCFETNWIIFFVYTFFAWSFLFTVLLLEFEVGKKS